MTVTSGWQNWTLLGACLLLTACATPMRSYDNELKKTVNQVATGRIDQAVKELEQQNVLNKDFLYYLEKGELLRLQGDYRQSLAQWREADDTVKQWEQEARLNPAKLLGDIGSVIINDKVRRYDGQDYEKVMLSTRLALGHLALNDWDSARIEIKKMHEREAIIAELRAKAVEKVEEEAKTRHVEAKIKDLKGYPVETLDDPAVVALKNSYQSAFSHYLAGFVYESLGEKSLAAPGYRKAIELRPQQKILEEGLRGLDGRMSNRRKANETDVLLVVETGVVPAKSSVTIPLPLRLEGKWVATPLSFPMIKKTDKTALPSLSVDQTPLALASVTSTDAMARRALRDDMPGIILRTAVRAVLKTAAQKVANDKMGPFGGLLVGVAAVASEGADERVWRLLPEQFSLVRLRLAKGKHTLLVKTAHGDKRFNFEAKGAAMVLPLRVLGQEVYLMAPGQAPEKTPEPKPIDQKTSTQAAT